MPATLPSGALLIDSLADAEAVLDGRQTLVVKTRPYDIGDDDWLLVNGNMALGTWRLGEPSMVGPAELDALESETLISSAVRKTRWPGTDEFWTYPIMDAVPLGEPKAVVVPGETEFVAQGIEIVEKHHGALVTEEALARAALHEVQRRTMHKQDARGKVAGLLRSTKKTIDVFVRSTLALATGPAGALRILKSLPETMAAAEGALVGAGIRPDRVEVPTGATDTLRLLMRMIPKARDANDATAKSLDTLLDVVENVLTFNLMDVEDTGLLKRGFPAPDPEGGVHAHGLRRSRGGTFEDGRHLHIYVIDGRLVATEEDGEHEHAFDKTADRTKRDGDHKHKIRLPTGEEVETGAEGSGHDHDMLVFTTGFDGTHRHSLRLPDGRTLRSLTSAEFVDMFPDAARAATKPIDTASEILKS